MATDIIVMDANRVDFLDDSGQAVQGVSIIYNYGNTEESTDYRTGMVTRRGIVEYEEWLPLPVWTSIRAVPGLYTPTEEQRSMKDKKGKARRVTKIVDLEYIAAVQISVVQEGSKNGHAAREKVEAASAS